MKHKANRRSVIKSSTPLRATAEKGILWTRVFKVAIAVVSASGVIIGCVTGGLALNDRLFPHPPNVIVESYWLYSHILGPRLTDVPPNFEWESAFSITNLESRSIGIVAFDPHFEPVIFENHIWEVNATGGALLGVHEFDSESKLSEEMLANSQKDSLSANPPIEDSLGDRPPLVIKSGEKANIVLDLFLRIYRDGQMCNFKECQLPTGTRFQTILLGGWLDHTGRSWCIKRDVPYKIRLDDGRVLDRVLPSWVGAVGCIGPILHKPDTPGGGAYLEPPPE